MQKNRGVAAGLVGFWVKKGVFFAPKFVECTFTRYSGAKYTRQDSNLRPAV
jgi:hypothetical protein